MSAQDIGLSTEGSGPKMVTYSTAYGSASGQIQIFDWARPGIGFTYRAGATFTAPAMTATTPPQTVLNFLVPTSYTLIIDDAYMVATTADELFARLSRRYLFFGWNSTAVPANPAQAPSTVLATSEAGMDIGAFSYRVKFHDIFGRYTGASATSPASTTVAGQRTIQVATSVALPTGAVGYALFRTSSNGATYYFLDHITVSTAWRDGHPDADLDLTVTAGAATTWGGSPTTAVASGGCEVIMQIVSSCSVLPAQMTYVNSRGKYSVVAVTPANSVNNRHRPPLDREGGAFTSTAGAVLGTSMLSPFIKRSDFGATAVKGFDGSTGTDRKSVV